MTALLQTHRRLVWNYALLIACGVVSVALYSLFEKLRVPVAPNEAAEIMQSFGVFVALLLVLFIGAALALKSIVRTSSRAFTPSMLAIIGFAIWFRIVLLPQTPFLSNDIYRYLWDAEVLDRGINPYLYPPAANELSSLHDLEIYGKMSHKGVHTVYPPVLQGLFWAGIKLAQALAINPIHAVKALWILFDLLLIFVLARLLAEYQIDSRWAMLYAWHPLAVIEIASSGHPDGVGACFLLAALFFLKRERYVYGAMFLALGFLVKFVTILLLPLVFLFSLQPEQKKYNWSALAAFLAVLVLSYFPFMAAGEKLYSGLSVYSAKWRFNDALVSLLFAPLQALFPDRLVIWLMIPPSWEITPETLLSRRIDLVLVLTKAAMALLFAAIYLRLWHYTKQRAATIKIIWPQISVVILTAFFLLSPTFQPWYLLWVLPVLCVTICEANTSGGTIESQRSTIRLLDSKSRLTHLESALLPRFKLYLWILSGAVFLSYWVLYAYWGEGIWQEQAWVKWVEYGLPGLVFFLPAKYFRPARKN